MKLPSSIWVLGTGGTISGSASDASDHVGYQAGVVSVADLLRSSDALENPVMRHTLYTQQISQVDSKDMGPAVWIQLLQALTVGMADEQVAAIVIAHGTDTIEETAALIAWALPVHKPVVLTCAMRPASARFPDGPQNLRDALAVAQDALATGVSVVAAGKVHAAVHVHKVHAYQLDAFDSFEQSIIARVEEGRVRWLPAAQAWRSDPHVQQVQGLNWDDWQSALDWPRVEWITSHADSGSEVVDALLAHTSARRLRGLVVAGTGNGTVHQALLPALVRARDAGVLVWRTTRCIGSSVVDGTQTTWPPSVRWSPSKARIALMLACMQEDTKQAT